jgi:hypothetical protein
MKMGWALGSDNIPIEIWRCLEDLAEVLLTKLFNNIFWFNKMSDEWRKKH